ERNEAVQMRQEMTFEEFVRWIEYSSATCIHSSPHRYQLDWFVDANGKMLADFIGRFERLQEDWAVIAKKLGVSEVLPHARANPRARHYTEYYTPETQSIIDEELLRLGLQHRVWRPVVLDCWQKAGITTGKRVLDLGAGPGYAALDLAEIVGRSGEVVALERSGKFVAAMRESFRRRGLTNAKIYELDLMTGDLPKGNYDFSWCRWVLSFVKDQGLLIKKL